MSESLFEKYDKILLMVRNVGVPSESFLEIFPYSHIQGVLQKLKNDNYIYGLESKYEDFSTHVYFLTAEGEHFLSIGGYTKQAELDQQKKIKENQNTAFQKMVSGLTLLAVIAAVVVSVVSLYYSNKGEEAKITTQEQLQEQMKLQKKLLLKTDSMQLLINTLISQDSLLKKHL